jgi:hypothetical protein
MVIGSGLFWSFGSIVNVVVMHLIAPPVLAFAIAVLFCDLPISFQLLSLAGALAVGVFIRTRMYEIWSGIEFINADTATHGIFFWSFITQLMIAFTIWTIVRLVMWKWMKSRQTSAGGADAAEN